MVLSEPKLISPMLDGFAMGDPISSHDGVRCCPAMQENSDKKYIVKIISIPASRTQLDALLLAGAYPSAEAAQKYFLSLAEGIAQETKVLEKLSKLEGFLAYEKCQYVPMDDGAGCDVYLLSTYKRALDRYFKHSPLTHLGAVNLGIDLCAALAECRRAGYLYVDLKPGNVFVTDDGSYRIGDIGFVAMDSLRYCSIPERCRSSWTAPELQDPLATLNPTVDIYALGLILYQAYNNGTLPFTGNAPSEPLPPPMYADYEMAEIILKACAPKPEDRWQEPAQMGQALVAYMQRNGANDTPIIPPKPAEPEQPETPPVEEAAPAEEPASEEADELSFIRSLVSDETAPSDESAEGLGDAGLTQEGSDILAQADELIAHEAPGPAVAPDPVEIPMPDPIFPDKEEDAEQESTEEDPDHAEPDAMTDEELEEHKRQVRAKTKKIVKRVVTATVTVLLLAALVIGGWFFYTEYYLQEITDVKLEGFEDSLTVRVVSEADESLLTVWLTDTFGNVVPAPVKNGVAEFTDLTPGSQFTIDLQISGLHKLKGITTYAYSTQSRTNIVSFTATAGAEDGSVILNFTVDGPDLEEWTVGYVTEGEEERFVTFPGHMATVNGLTVGSNYVFRLVPTSEIYLVGADQLEYTAVKVVYAENLTITNCADSTLTVVWTAPKDASISKWSVRCYDDSGYDETIETGELTASFSGIDTAKAHTVEVTAEGMTQCTRTYVTANPVTVTSIHGNNGDPTAIGLEWEYTGTAPEGGWLLMYTIDNSEQQVIKCEDPSAVVSPKIPGSHYSFTLQAANGVTVFGGVFSADAPEAVTFEGYGVSADYMTFRMCRTPDVEDWDHNDLDDDSYTTEFTIGQAASFSVYLSKEYNVAYDDIITLYVIRDSEGKIVSTETQTRAWAEMWLKGYCELDVPSLPDTAGTYTMEIYFNGASAATQEFTMVENTEE